MKEFWKSKTVWVSGLGFAVVLINSITGLVVPELAISGVIAVLTVLFRWQAEGPLTVKKQ